MADNKLVENNVVKMEWNSNEFLTRKSKFIDELFAGAWRRYTNADGVEIAVGFSVGVAYVWGAEDDIPNGLWTVKQMKDFLKAHCTEPEFPDEYEDYRPIALGDGQDNEELKPLLKLSDAQWADIHARINDLAPYGDEVEVNAF